MATARQIEAAVTAMTGDRVTVEAHVQSVVGLFDSTIAELTARVNATSATAAELNVLREDITKVKEALRTLLPVA